MVVKDQSLAAQNYSLQSLMPVGLDVLVAVVKAKKPYLEQYPGQYEVGDGAHD